MKFYDKNRNLHDTRFQAVKSNVKITFGNIFHFEKKVEDDDPFVEDEDDPDNIINEILGDESGDSE